MLNDGPQDGQHSTHKSRQGGHGSDFILVKLYDGAILLWGIKGETHGRRLTNRPNRATNTHRIREYRICLYSQKFLCLLTTFHPQQQIKIQQKTGLVIICKNSFFS